MTNQGAPPGPRPGLGKPPIKNMTKQISSLCVDIVIINMLLLALETDNKAKAAEAIQLLKAVMAKQGY